MKLRQRFVRSMFALLYDSYDYPFVKGDQLIATMLPEEQKDYYRRAKQIVDNPTYRQELQESIRHFYQELAIKKHDPTHESLMLGALLFIKNFDSRMMALAASANPPQVTELTDMD